VKTLLAIAGGFGSRLKSVVSDVPKPLAPVGGKTFLSFWVENCVRQGVDDFVFLLHYKAEQMTRAIFELEENGYFGSASIRYLVESSPLGTAGAVINAIRELNITSPFLVSNVDTWLGDGISDVNQSEMSSVAIIKVPDCRRYGRVEHDGFRVKSFFEKSVSVGAGDINAGLYQLNPNDFDLSKEGFVSLEREVLPKLVERENLAVVPVSAKFIDIGVPEDYFRFCAWMKNKEAYRAL
tara:strand:- start:398 stop:1111 length:714 start_codon:yes stop_codon:yes gene_type:complete